MRLVSKTPLPPKTPIECETELQELVGNFRRYKWNVRPFAQTLIRKRGFEGARQLINGAWRQSITRQNFHGPKHAGNRNNAVEAEYQNFLRRLSSSFRKSICRKQKSLAKQTKQLEKLKR